MQYYQSNVLGHTSCTIYTVHSPLPEALGERLGHPPHLVPFHVQTAQKKQTS